MTTMLSINDSSLAEQTFGRRFSSNLKSMTNEELVIDCQTGVHDALEELMRRYRSSIFNAAFRLARNQDAAEDVTALTCLRICKGIGTCKYPAALSAWINRIVRNVWLDSLRSSQRRSEVSLDIIENLSADNLSVPYETQSSLPLQKRVEDSDRKRILNCAIATLPAAQSKIVIMFYVEDKPYEEIADIMGIPVGTVKSRLSRARFALRRKLTSHVSALMD